MFPQWMLPSLFGDNPSSWKKLNTPRLQSPSGFSLAVWEEELENDECRDFILNGLRNGFVIIDPDAYPAVVESENHISARPGSTSYKEATALVLKEIEIRHYKVVSDPPDIISPIAGILKPDGGVRLIHDCSRAEGLAFNDYCTSGWKQKFARVDGAVKFVTPGCFMAKVDLKQAYRSVLISEHSQQVTGLKLQFGNSTVYLQDTRLCFAAKLAPDIFHQLTQGIKRMLKCHGLKATVVYLDDFIIEADCISALITLIFSP